MKVGNLAIVIPAYKKEYLHTTLRSISNQTNKNFTLYIGDDASPHRLYDVISCYVQELSIEYTRFECNLGGQDLVGHWHRCIHLVKDEEWIWLFSDDDIMDPNCVEAFYSTVSSNPTKNLFHFDVNVIDQDGKAKYPVRPFNQMMGSYEFFRQKILGVTASFVVEYIIKKNYFLSRGGFESFDLAFCSDDATWIKLSVTEGIFTVKGPMVYWRHSGVNISSIAADKTFFLRKMYAVCDYLVWTKLFFSANNIPDNLSDYFKLKWAMQMFRGLNIISFREKVSIVNKMIKGLDIGLLRFKIYAYLVYSSCYKGNR